MLNTEIKAEELIQFINEQFHEYIFEAKSKKVYHYTTLSALHSMISNSEIRLTNSMYMNDKHEYYDFLNMTKQILDSFGDTELEGEVEELKEIYARNFFEHERGLEIGLDYKDHLAYYIFSTCGQDDYVPMWSNYSQSDGVSIEFDASILYYRRFKPSVLDGDMCYGYKCVYDEEVKKEIIRRCLNKYIELNEGEEDIYQLITYMNIMINHSYLFKSHAFKYEEERRYVFRLDYSKLHEDLNGRSLRGKKKNYKKIRYDIYTTNKTIKPCIYVNVGKLPITKITVSPKNRDETVINGIKAMLERYGYEIKRGENSPGIDVVASTCPFR